MNIRSAGLFTLMALSLSLNAQAGYQYTYTGNQFTYLNTLQGAGSYTGTELTDSDAVTVVIKSNNLLTTSSNFLNDATVEFFSSDYYKKALPTDFSGPVAKLSQLEISSYDVNGLPLTWSLNYNEFTNAELNPDYKAYEGFGFSSYSDGSYMDDSASYVLVEPIAQENVCTSYGQSNASGRWTLSAFDGPVSPVPEMPVNGMLLIGIGMLAYFVQQKKAV
jgi:hypothetical protein